jgi:hypothetical protein
LTVGIGERSVGSVGVVSEGGEGGHEQGFADPVESWANVEGMLSGMCARLAAVRAPPVWCLGTVSGTAWT